MNSERNYCLVPDCDEQPYPGDTLCDTHQREDRAILDASGRYLADAPVQPPNRPSGPHDANRDAREPVKE